MSRKVKINSNFKNRWYNHLCPSVKKSKWTEKEDQIIMQAHNMYYINI